MAHPDIITRYDYLLREYPADFKQPLATFAQLSQAFSEASSDGLSTPVEYRHSTEFAAKYAAGGFLGVGDLQDGLDAHNNGMVALLPCYKQLLEAQVRSHEAGGPYRSVRQMAMIDSVSRGSSLPGPITNDSSFRLTFSETAAWLAFGNGGPSMEIHLEDIPQYSLQLWATTAKIPWHFTLRKTKNEIK
eukprot:gene20934-1144_t